MSKAKQKNIPLVILIIIYAALLFGAYNSIATLALGLWGEEVTGSVDSYYSRLDNKYAGENRSRTVSKGYSFFVNGKNYSGYVVYLSDENMPKLSEGETRRESILYFKGLPFINKPSALADFDEMGIVGIAYHLFAPFGCAFLAWLVTPKSKSKRRNKIKAAKKRKQ